MMTQTMPAPVKTPHLGTNPIRHHPNQGVPRLDRRLHRSQPPAQIGRLFVIPGPQGLVRPAPQDPHQTGILTLIPNPGQEGLAHPTEEDHLTPPGQGGEFVHHLGIRLQAAERPVPDVDVWDYQTVTFSGHDAAVPATGPTATGPLPGRKSIVPRKSKALTWRR